jgi:hypothetical protein
MSLKQLNFSTTKIALLQMCRDGVILRDRQAGFREKRAVRLRRTVADFAKTFSGSESKIDHSRHRGQVLDIRNKRCFPLSSDDFLEKRKSA